MLSRTNKRRKIISVQYPLRSQGFFREFLRVGHHKNKAIFDFLDEKDMVTFSQLSRHFKHIAQCEIENRLHKKLSQFILRADEDWESGKQLRKVWEKHRSKNFYSLCVHVDEKLQLYLADMVESPEFLENLGKADYINYLRNFCEIALCHPGVQNGLGKQTKQFLHYVLSCYLFDFIDNHFQDNEEELVIIKKLVKLGADINYLVKIEADINFYFRSNTKSAYEISVMKNLNRCLRFFLEKGANPNQLFSNGKRPLVYAFENRSDETAKILLHAGADVNVKCGKKCLRHLMPTPIFFLTLDRYPYLQTGLIQLFLEHADFNAVDYEGNTLLMFAIADDNFIVANLLLKKYGQLINVNHQCKFGLTALMIASERGTEDEYIKDLLKLGADPFLKDKNGNTALSLALNKEDRSNPIIEIIVELLEEAESEKKQELKL